MNTIQAGQTLTARSLGDHDCIFTAEVVERKKSFVTLRVHGDLVRKKVSTDWDGNEGVYALGRFSMAPFFRAPEALAA